MTHADRMRTVAAPDPEGEEGSIGVLSIGLMLILLLVVAAVAAVSSVYIEQRRLQLVADQCSDAATSRVGGFTDGPGPPTILLDSDAAAQACAQVLREVPHGIDGAFIVDAAVEDGNTARIHLSGTAHPPLLTLFIPDGVTVEATSRSRVTVGR